MRQISAADFAEAGFPLIGTPYTTLDCQAFWEKCRELCGDYINKKGSNAWYRTMTWVGTPEDCIKKFGSIPKGATLFIHAFDGGEEKVGYHDGKGNASHIGIKTGRGEGAIHSSSTKKGVVESSFKDKTIPNGGWNCVGLWAEGFDYGEKINALLRGETPSADPDPEPVDPVDPMPDEPTVFELAQVWSENGKSVKMRATPTTSQKLWDPLAYGTIVEVIRTRGDWSQINGGKRKGWWIMSKFLKPYGDAAGEQPIDTNLVNIEIQDIPLEEAQALKAKYPKAVISVG